MASVRGTCALLIPGILAVSPAQATIPASDLTVDDAVDCHFVYTYGLTLGVVTGAESREVAAFWLQRAKHAKGAITPGLSELAQELHDLEEDPKSFVTRVILQLDNCDATREEILTLEGKRDD